MAAPNYIADREAKEALRGEIQAQGYRFGYKTMKELGTIAGIRHNTMAEHLKEPDMMRLDELRVFVRKLRLDPAVVLKVLGYSNRDIKKCLEE